MSVLPSRDASVCKSVAIMAGLVLACSLPLRAADSDPRDDASPWGINEHWSPKIVLDPMLDQAGVRWIRAFAEWQEIQPRQGQWNWDLTDKIVASAGANHQQVLGTWLYFAPWASADGGTRRGPIKDMQYWRDYVTETVKRYHKDIKYWEVWNEFDGSFYEGRQGADKVKDYADLVVAAYDAAKKVDPEVKIGTCVGISFLDQVIKAGAADHFDFVAVHPYSNLNAVDEGREMGYLGMADNIRQMLAANKQRAGIQLWVTECGQTAPMKPEPKRDAWQAQMLVKDYILSIVQGFRRVFWYAALADSEDNGVTDYGVVRHDMTPRPSYDASKTMTTLLGKEPQYLGWLDPAKGGYGFVFHGSESDVLVAWAPVGKSLTVAFATETQVTDLAGKRSALPAGQALALSNTPVFISRLPAALVREAQANRGKPYPWGGDYARATTVTCALGFTNTEEGLTQIHPDTTVTVSSGVGLAEDCRRTDFSRRDMEGHYVYFQVDPQFAPFGTRELEITITARRVSPGREAGMGLCYESAAKGYTGAQGYWTIPADDQWHEHTWKVSDANFASDWGWNFRFDAIGSPNEFLVKRVRVARTLSASTSRNGGDQETRLRDR